LKRFARARPGHTPNARGARDRIARPQAVGDVLERETETAAFRT
jgi:hypothetical protein